MAAQDAWAVLAEFNFADEADAPSPLSEGELAAIVDHVLAAEGVSVPCAVSLTLVSDAEMRALNAEWRGVDAPTDVLSLECERPEEAVGLCELGDIVLAPAFVAAQAPRFGNTPAQEACLLTIHATLHLLGYDHLADDEAERMEALEDGYLAELSAEATGGRLTRHDDEGGPA